MKYIFPDNTAIEIEHLILDLNGTIATDGVLIGGVQERVQAIKKLGIHIVLFSGDTNGTAKNIAEQLGIDFTVTKNSYEKGQSARTYPSLYTATIGNGRIDKEVFDWSTLAIAVLGQEGLSASLLSSPHTIVTSNIIDALDLFLFPNRLIATLRP